MSTDEAQLLAQDIADRIMRSVAVEQELETVKAELDAIKAAIPVTFHPNRTTEKRVEILGNYVSDVKLIANNLKNSAKDATDELQEMLNTSNK